MVWPVVDQVATLAKALQIARPIVARIVVEVGGGENDPRLSYPGCLLDVGPASEPSTIIAPSLTSGVKPASIRQAANSCAMRSAATLADAAGALEAHIPAQLRPVDRIKPAHLSFDRHLHPRSRCRWLVCPARDRHSPARSRAGERSPPGPVYRHGAAAELRRRQSSACGPYRHRAPSQRRSELPLAPQIGLEFGEDTEHTRNALPAAVPVSTGCSVAFSETPRTLRSCINALRDGIREGSGYQRDSLRRSWPFMVTPGCPPSTRIFPFSAPR